MGSGRTTSIVLVVLAVPHLLGKFYGVVLVIWMIGVFSDQYCLPIPRADAHGVLENCREVVEMNQLQQVLFIIGPLPLAPSIPTPPFPSFQKQTTRFS